MSEGIVAATLPLPIAGLISDQDYLTLYEQLQTLNHSIKILQGNNTFNPFLTLSFLSLTVIPTLKLTDKGLFDFHSFSYKDVAVDR